MQGEEHIGSSSRLCLLSNYGENVLTLLSETFFIVKLPWAFQVEYIVDTITQNRQPGALESLVCFFLCEIHSIIQWTGMEYYIPDPLFEFGRIPYWSNQRNTPFLSPKCLLMIFQLIQNTHKQPREAFSVEGPYLWLPMDWCQRKRDRNSGSCHRDQENSHLYYKDSPNGL